MWNSKSHPLHSWLPLLGTVILATILWFITFYLAWGNFWVKISFSAASLALLSIWIHPPPINQFSITVKSLGLGLLSAAVLYVLFWLGHEISTALFSFAQSQISAVYGKGENTSRWLIILLLLFVTGPSEELFWRGYLQQQLMERLGNWQGWLVATLIYSAVHIWSFNFMLIGAAAVAGAFWGWLYWRWRNLTMVIVSHAVWSAVIFAVFPIL